jgi:hypothetical protein
MQIQIRVDPDFAWIPDLLSLLVHRLMWLRKAAASVVTGISGIGNTASHFPRVRLSSLRFEHLTGNDPRR